jgi:Lipopolysaccharide kinase (Kdo/WaaP) family
MARALPNKTTQGQYFVQPEHESILLANHLTNANDLLSLAGGTMVRAMPGRTTRRIELNRPDGSKTTAYLKSYEGSLPRLQRWLGLPGGAEDGLESLNEWRQILALRKLGFHTAAPIAAGWQRVGKTIRSFVMTAEITGAVSGYDFWAASNDSQRRNFIPQLADLARRFHQAGFIHKDFYLGHIFVAEREGELELTLIDLQRVMGPQKFRTRWLLKDFGSMLFALQKAGAKHAGLMRFFKLYKKGEKIGATEKNFLRKALKRAAWLHQRKPKHGEPESE